MDVKKFLVRFGTALLTAVLAIALVAPAFATEVNNAEIEGEIGKIIKGMDIPAMVKEHHPDVVKILKVDGIGVLVTKDTDIEFKDEEQMKLMVGDDVRITGKIGVIFAEKIVLTYEETGFRADFNGERARVDGTIGKVLYPPGVKAVLLIDGVHVVVKDTTMVEGKLTAGAGVEVTGKLHAIMAKGIELLD
jgi:hypothetical protein